MANQSNKCASKEQRTIKVWKKESMILCPFLSQFNHYSSLTPVSDSSVKDGGNLDN